MNTYIRDTSSGINAQGQKRELQQKQDTTIKSDNNIQIGMTPQELQKRYKII